MKTFSIPATLTKDQLRTLATRRGLVNLKPLTRLDEPTTYPSKTIRYVKFAGQPDASEKPVKFRGHLHFEKVDPDNVDSHGGYFDSLPLTCEKIELPHNPPENVEPEPKTET